MQQIFIKFFMLHFSKVSNSSPLKFGIHIKKVIKLRSIKVASAKRGSY